MKRMRVRTVAAITCLVAAVVVSATGCSLQPEDLPSVRGGVGDAYTLEIDFDSVMNLPSGADVILDSFRIGEVQKVEVNDDGKVAVVASIGEDAQVPSNIRAIIRQDTLLGDTYVALLRDLDAPSTTYLGEGDTIPIDRTVAPPQLEDTMAVLATFINGGTIQRVQDMMRNANTVMPPQKDLRALAGVVSTDLHDLGSRTDEIDRTLDGLNNTAEAVNNNTTELSTVFDSSTVHYWQSVSENIYAHIGTILPSIGSVFEGGLWLVPMFNSLADSLEGASSEWPKTAVEVSNLAQGTLLPFAKNPSVDIVSVQNAEGKEISSDVGNLLRMLGAAK